MTNKGKDASEYTRQSTHGNDQMMKSLWRELDKVKNAMKGKSAMNLNGMLKRIVSLFTANVLECPLPPKFFLPQLEFYKGFQDNFEPQENSRRGHMQVFSHHPQGSCQGVVQ